MNENFRIRKVNVLALIQALYGIYNQGVDWVDICGEQIDGEDIVGLIFRKEYMAEEEREKFDDMIKDEKTKLTDEYIRKLI